MPIDVFSRERFEQALPVHKDTGKPLWQGIGLREGEECYIIPVRLNPGVLIYIRSSVKENGYAAESAEDSIRCWLAADITGRGLGSKPKRWITRVNGWDKRLTEQLQLLWRVGRRIEACHNPAHADDQFITLRHAYRVKDKESKNYGQWFLKCPACGEGFEWITQQENNAPQH
jgi:hypothetical protein